MAQQGQKIDLNDMNINQVVQVKKQLDNEINLLETSIVDLYNAKDKFVACSSTVDDFKTIENNSSLMVPLSSSLYVPGKVVDNDSFLLDIGTKYYVEKNREKTVDYFNRKSKFLMEQIENIVAIVREKAMIRQSVIEIIQQKEMQAIAAQSKGQQKV